MATHSALVSVTYKIVGEAEEFQVYIPITVDETSTAEDISNQMSATVDSHESSETLVKFSLALVSHLAEQTRD